MEYEIMAAFLELFIKELEYAIIHGFETLYNYLLELIFKGLPLLSKTKDFKLRKQCPYTRWGTI